MATIREPVLSVQHVAGHEAQRCVRVEYDLVCEPADHLVDQEIIERILVHAVDEHDAAVRPNPDPIAQRKETFVGNAGTEHRSVEFIVHRSDLDVQRDWLSTDADGELRPIAEWSDHIAADVKLTAFGRIVNEATTPIVTGSWGPLSDSSD